MNIDVEVVVVGGGAMGSAAAWQLARRGREVLLLERFEQGHVRGSSHGASRIFRLSYPDLLYVRMAQRALVLWRLLEDESGLRLLDLTGGVDHGPVPLVEENAAALAAAGAAFEWLSVEEAQERWPGLRFEGRVLNQLEAGRVHGDRTMEACQAAAVANGAIVRHKAAVEKIVPRGADAIEVRTADCLVRARRAVVAVGAWASKLLPDVGLPLLETLQQQPAHFATAVPAQQWPSFIHRGYGNGASGFGAYGLFTPDEGVKVGLESTGVAVDPDERDFASTPDGQAALRRYVERWVPGADPESAVPISCLYSSKQDEDFVMDRRGSLVIGAGFSGHGFKFVPHIGEVLADLVEGKPPPDRRFRLP